MYHDDFYISANGSHGRDGQDEGDSGDGYTPENQGRYGETPEFVSGLLYVGDAVMRSFPLRLVAQS